MKKKKINSKSKNINVDNKDTNNKVNRKTYKNNNKIKKKKEPIWKKILFILLCLFILGMLAMGAFFYYVVKSSPEFSKDKLYESQTSILLDKDGREFAKIGEKNREIVTYDELPEVLVDAIVATEDARFFQHNGFDLPRFLVASAKQLLGQSDAGGASTLTMQISKNKITSNIASGLQGVIRKFQDIYISIFKIEKYYTKQEIIEFYVNSNYLGGSAWGVEAASNQYFGKSVKDLTLPEAAMIAGIFNAPVYYDGLANPENCEERRRVVLYLMKRHGYINDEEYNSALEMTVSKLTGNSETTNNKEYQSFINTVVEEVIDKTGHNPYSTPMIIHTTMDTGMQEYMEKLMRGELESYKWENDTVQAGAVILNSNNGSIAAIGAGRNRNERDYNYATDIERQIGSTAKPLYDYGPAIEYLNWGSGTMILDESWAYTGTNIYIKNWDSRFSGFTNVRNSIIDSKNIPALKAFQSVPNNKIYKYVTSMGLNPETSGNTVHESHSLGGYTGENPLSMAAAYNVYSSGGYYIEPYSFTKIEYIETGESYTHKPVKTKVVSSETAFIISDILIDTANSYDYRYRYINGVTYGCKSGTSNLTEETIKLNKLPSNAVNDLWMAGYNGSYSVAVWYGYDYLSNKTYNTFGSKQNNRLFQAVAKAAFKTSLNTKLPSGVIEVEIEKESNLLASPYTPSNMKTKELYKKGTEPTEVSTRFSQLNNVTNLKAEANYSTVTLTWDPIELPKAIDEEYLKTQYYKLYKDAKTANNTLYDRYQYNKNKIGTVTYDIYEKDSDGNLKFIDTTSENSIEIESLGGDLTYVVKSSYTIFKDNASSGASVSVTATLSSIEASLTNPLITIDLNSEYTNDTVIIYENGELIDNSKAVITFDTSKLNTTLEGEYEVLVTVKYKTYNEVLKQIVKVK